MFLVYTENESRNLPLLIAIRFDWKFTKQDVLENLILILTMLWTFYNIVCTV